MSIPQIIRRAMRMGRIKDGLVLCDNCDTPADKTLSRQLSWTACGPCALGEADSFDAGNLIHADFPKKAGKQ